jgi:hypothetical protein
MYNVRIRDIFQLFVVLSIVSLFVGCGSGGGGGSSSSNNTNPEGTSGGIVSGTVYAPDGTTPIANSYIYVPSSYSPISALVVDGIPEGVITWTISGPDGSFKLANVPTGKNIPIRIVKGKWSISLTVDVAKDYSTDLAADKTKLPSEGEGAPHIAVVTGWWDNMEDVLAKLGMGSVDDEGVLTLGTENFDLYSGSGDLPDYPGMEALLSDPQKMATYNIIFINCGADQNIITSNPGIIKNIKDYVNNGGAMYITDLSYDFVEQTFPEKIDFFGSDGTPANEAEGMWAADVGMDGITTEATVLDVTLKGWLNNRKALNADGTVHIEGFMSGWAVMNDVTTDGTAKKWIEGNVELESSASGVRPLTVSFNYGKGKVLYTSYHASESDHIDLLPQELILSYLVFEM